MELQGCNIGGSGDCWRSCGDAMMGGHPVGGDFLDTLYGRLTFVVRMWKEMSFRAPSHLSDEMCGAFLFCYCY